MDSSVPGIACVLFVALFFVVPMYAYIVVTERRAKQERAKAIEAGRHEPVTIQPYIDPAVCMGSGACATACPEHVLSVIEGQAVAVNMSACIGHGACVTICPVGAIELVFGSEKRGIDIPRVGPDFQTNVKGVYIAGELGGMGLIANAAEQGTRALGHAIEGLRKGQGGMIDVAIVGAGPAGLAAAAAAKVGGWSYVVLEQDEFGGAIRHYPRKKLVFTRPMEISGYKKVNVRTLHKEALVDVFKDIISTVGIDISAQERVDKISAKGGGFSLQTTKRTVEAQRVILCLGRRGTPRKLGAIGEDVEKVAYSLLEPENYKFDHLMVVGGGDSAVEAAIQLSEQEGNKVTLSYRGDKINRPKEKNIERLRDAQREGRVEVLLESQVKEIRKDRIVVDHKGEELVMANDYVFVMVGGVLPTKFLQNVGIQIEKHYGKRVEVEEGADAPQAVPTRSEGSKTPAASPPSLPPLRAKGNDEVTQWLGPPIGTDEVVIEKAPPTGVAAEPTRPLGRAPAAETPDELDDLELEPVDEAPARKARAPSAPVAPASLPLELVAMARAAQHRLDAGGYEEVLGLTHQLNVRLNKAKATMSDEALGAGLQLAGMLEGEARLALFDPAGAVDPLSAALASAPPGVIPGAGDRIRWALAQALAGAGQPHSASDVLADLLSDLDRDDPRHYPAVQLGAELALELGDFELSDARYGAVAEAARDAGETGDVAGAMRGLALAIAARGQPRAALRQLSEALSLLGGDSDPVVVARTLSEAVALECALGRYASAIGHAETLLDWTVDQPLYRARAHALLGEAHAAIGAYARALQDATHAAELSAALDWQGTDAKLRAARLLCDLGRHKSARSVIERMGAPPESLLHDFVGQQLAIRARLAAAQEPDVARQLAGSALARRGALYPLSNCALALDSARALVESRNPLPARSAIKRALSLAPGADPKGVRLELLVVLHETNPDDAQVSAALARTALRVMAELPKELAATFRARGNLAPHLAANADVDASRDPVTRPLAVPPVPR